MSKKGLFVLIALTLLTSLFASQMMVLGEVFSANWCPSCPTARSLLSDLNDAYGEEYLIPLVWETEEAQGDARYGWYPGNGFVPWVIFGGTIEPSWSSYSSYEQAYQNISALESPLEIEMEMVADEEGLSTEVTAEVTVTGQITTTDNKLFLALTKFVEDSDANYVNKVVAYEGEFAFDLTTVGETVTYEHTFNIDASWNVDELHAVAVVQSWVGSKDVLQAATCLNSPPVNPVSPLELDFGEVEVGNSKTLPFTITNNHEDLTLSGDIYGIPNFEMPSNYEIAPLESMQMDVTFTPPAANTYIGDAIITCNDPDFQVISLHLAGTGVNTANDDEIVPNKATLLGNYPNPFNPETKIEFQLNNQADAQIVIYNLKGEKIRTFSNLEGKNEIIWNGTNQQGNRIASGIYLYKIAGSDNSPRKMILLK
jgi:hypothetical protein